MVNLGDVSSTIAGSRPNSSLGSTARRGAVEETTATIEGRHALASRITKGMVKQGLSREGLAAKAGVSTDTVHDILNRNRPAKCSLSTLHKLENVLGPLIEEEELDAPEDLGGYSAKDARRYIGKYLCIRPYFDEKSKFLNVYEIEISWSRPDHCLKFSESKRHDPSHENSGKIYIKDGLPYMYLLTVDAGEVRHIVLSRTLKDGKFRGMIQTLWHLGGERYMPANAPIILHKIPENEPQDFDLGKIDRKSPMYAQYCKWLSGVVTDGYVQQFSVPA